MTPPVTEQPVTLKRLRDLIDNHCLWYGRAVNDHNDVAAALRELLALRSPALEPVRESDREPKRCTAPWANDWVCILDDGHPGNHIIGRSIRR